MDLNINELPERDRPRRDLEIVEMPNMVPPRQSAATIAKVVALLAVVVTLTVLAINSHHVAPGESTAASDAPPAVAASGTLPSIAAPTDRATTGVAPRAPATPPPSGSSQ
jgi:hypothetical protein